MAFQGNKSLANNGGTVAVNGDKFKSKDNILRADIRTPKFLFPQLHYFVIYLIKCVGKNKKQ